MKKLFLILALIGVAITSAFAQPAAPPDSKMLKEIKEYKIKFLAQEMELKPEQTAKFAELYDKMAQEKFKIFEQMRSLEKKLKEDSSEAEYKTVSDKISECRLRDAQLDKEYDAKFASFLSQKQIYKMKTAEEKFRRKMQDMCQKNKGKRQRPARSKEQPRQAKKK